MLSFFAPIPSVLIQIRLQSNSNDLMQQAQIFVYANGSGHPPTAIELDKSLLRELLFNQSPAKVCLVSGVIALKTLLFIVIHVQQAALCLLNLAIRLSLLEFEIFDHLIIGLVVFCRQVIWDGEGHVLLSSLGSADPPVKKGILKIHIYAHMGMQ